jgi:transposase-like protein
VNCPVCGGPGVLLGTLGRRTHYRCRDCGMDFSTTDPDTDEEQA